MIKNQPRIKSFPPDPGLKLAPPSDSPLLRRSPWACGSVCRSPGHSCSSFHPPSRASATAATARIADPYLQLDEETDQCGRRRRAAQLNERRLFLRKLTVVFLHVGPQVSLFYTVGKGAVSNILTLLPSRHVHANLREDNWVSSCGDVVSVTSIWGGGYLKLQRDGFFGRERSDSCPLSPFKGTYEHHPRVFGPPEIKRVRLRTDHTHTHTHPPTCLNPRDHSYVCLALAEQYFLFLSASLCWPFRQHWPQANIIFRFGGPNLLCEPEICS